MIESNGEQGLVNVVMTLSQDSSVVQSWAVGWIIRVQVLEGARNFSLHHRVQTGSGAHPASYPMGTKASSLGDKVAGA
jgi:hypothetical protein